MPRFLLASWFKANTVTWLVGSLVGAKAKWDGAMHTLPVTPTNQHAL